MELSIIIVSWNVKELLRKCLESLVHQGSGVTFEIIVVDNASVDGTVEEFNVWRSNLGTRFDLVRLIPNSTNRGFAAACNQGARLAKGSVLLFLNPDCEARQNFAGQNLGGQGMLQQIMQFFVSHQDAGVMGGKILNSDGTVQSSVRRFPGLWDQLLILLGFQKIFPCLASLRRYFVADFNYYLEAQVDQVMGAFFVVPKNVFEKLHGFDEQFFVWFEEVDFCKRVQQAGLKVYYSPHVTVVHQGGASFKQVNPWRRRVIWLQSLWHYFRKHGL